MSSTILFKFRSGTTFEALPLPGTSARLFDVKRAIVKAKKLDVVTGNSQLEFDLSVRDATTQEEYVEEGMLLPRGTRVVVQRLPAARGHGFLSRMARADSGMGGGALLGQTQRAAPTGFYTIESRDHGEEDEFVQADNNSSVNASANGDVDEKELAELMAVTDRSSNTGGAFRGPQVASSNMHSSRVAGSGAPPPPRGGAGGQSNWQKQQNRPNADPELREQEQKLMPKKRATGIPRTFLNLSAPPATEGIEGDSNESIARLQPNALGFRDLLNRGGGQAESASGTRRDLDYALKLTATTIPEHLQCGICHLVVKNAMLLPWDMEGRTSCESCIRDGLTQNGFRCPLTGIEGVSPDDLHPNYGLRKAADLFVKGVMEKMDEIEQEQVEEPTSNEFEGGAGNAAGEFEGEAGDKGIILSRKTTKEGKKKNDDDDPFGDDDFGGDVFYVEPEKEDEEETVSQSDNADDSKTNSNGPANESKEGKVAVGEETKNTLKPVDERKNQNDGNVTRNKTETTVVDLKSNHFIGSEIQQNASNANAPVKHHADTTVSSPAKTHNLTSSKGSRSHHADQNTAPRNSHTSNDANNHTIPSSNGNRRDGRQRGPPAGYAMGPAGGAAVRSNSGPYTDRPIANAEKQQDGGHNSETDGQHQHGAPHHQVGGNQGGGGGRGRGGHGPGGGRGNYHNNNNNNNYNDRPPFHSRGRGGSGRQPYQGDGRGRFSQQGGGEYEQGRGGGGRGRDGYQQQAPFPQAGHSGGGEEMAQHHSTSHADDESRGMKRTRNGSDEGSGGNVGHREWGGRGGRHGGDYNRGGFNSHGGGAPSSFRGGFRGRGGEGGRGFHRGRGGHGRGRY